MGPFAAYLLTFLAVFVFIQGLPLLLKRKRVEIYEQDKPTPFIFRMFESEARQVGSLVYPVIKEVSPARIEMYEKDLISADLTSFANASEVCGHQTVLAGALAILSAVASLMMGLPFAGILGVAGFFALIGWSIVPMWIRQKAQERRSLISRGMPFALDILTVSMQAGQDFAAAVRTYVERAPEGPLRDEFDTMLREILLGKHRPEALRAMADRIQLDEFNGLVAAVVQSAELGSGLANIMKINSEEMRGSRYLQAEKDAGKASVKMVIPIALFIMPAVFIIIMAPVIIKMKGTSFF